MATNPSFDELLDTVVSGSTFDALRAAKQLAELSRKRRKAEDERLKRVMEEAGLPIDPKPGLASPRGSDEIDQAPAKK